MSTESDGFDPYAVVLADLKAKRDQIDQAIQAVESVRGNAPAPKHANTPEASAPSAAHAGAFLGMSIAEASKKLLAGRKQAMGNADIAKGLTDGGLVMSGKTDHQNIVGSVLTRRFDKVGDVVRVSRGIWGLKEWYPNRTFKPGAKTPNGDVTKPSSTAPEQPSAPPPSAAPG